MATSISGGMGRAYSIPLGIRIAVAGTPSFCREVCELLTADPDVAFVHRLDGIGRMDEGSFRVHALITEPDYELAQRRQDGAEWLSAVSLIAVVGSSIGFYDGFSNAERFAWHDSGGAAIIAAIKDRIVQLRLQEFSGLVSAMMSSETGNSREEGFLAVSTENGETQLPFTAIDWIRAAGSHVEIRTAGRSYLQRSGMETLQRQLPPTFLRIHRKVIVNLHRVFRIDADSSVRQFATLVTGERFLISRQRRTLVQARWAELRSQTA